MFRVEVVERVNGAILVPRTALRWLVFPSMRARSAHTDLALWKNCFWYDVERTAIVTFNLRKGVQIFWGTLQGTASTTPPINGNAKGVVSV